MTALSESPNEQWSEIITPDRKWFEFGLSELWPYRDLVKLFVYRDLVAVYKQTILGPLWHVIQPLLTTAVFTLIFSKISRLSTDGRPPFLFYMCGITIWNYFAQCLTKTSNTFFMNAHIFGKVYFPRLAVPLSSVISGLISFSIQLGFFFLICLYFYFKGINLHFGWRLLLVPYFVFLMATMGMGLGIIISSLTIKYRDLVHLVSFGVQLFMYASPIIYPLSLVPDRFRNYVILNPTVPVIEGFRYAFLGVGLHDLSWILYSTFTAIVLFLFGLALFQRVEKTFLDSV